MRQLVVAFLLAIVPVCFAAPKAAPKSEPNQINPKIKDVKPKDVNIINVKKQTSPKSEPNRIDPNITEVKRVNSTEVNSVRKEQIKQTVLKQKALLLRQKQNLLRQLTEELKTIPPTKRVPHTTRTTTTTTYSDDRGRARSNNINSYDTTNYTEIPNPDHARQKQRILVCQNNIAQLEKEIVQLNSSRIAKGEQPIE